MKLSKESLSFALWYAYRAENDTFFRAMIALETDTLEIEGFVRDERTKFDPDDESTPIESEK